MKTITGPITTEEADERLETTHTMIGNAKKRIKKSTTK